MKAFEFVDSRWSRKKTVILFHTIGGMIFLISLLGLALAERNSVEALQALVSPNVAFVRTLGTWRVSCVIQADSMAVGGGVKVRFVKGFAGVQMDEPNSSGYVSAATTSKQSQVAITAVSRTDKQVPWEWDRIAWVVTVQVQKHALYNGDTIHVVFGANPPQGRIRSPYSTFVDTILVAYDLNASGNYQEVTHKPVLEIRPRPAYRLFGYLPSTTTIGAPATLKIIVRDDYENLATSFTGTIALTTTDSLAALPNSLELTPSDRGSRNVEVNFLTPGIHEVQLRAVGKSPDSLWQARSNPIAVSREAALFKIFWGDLHSHSSFSQDAHGRDSFLKARDVTCLDFYALTDHTSNDFKTHGGLTPEEWEATKRDVISYHEPGKFVTFPAYEFSAYSPSGHHNIYFNAPDARIPEIPVLSDAIYLQVQKIWELKEALIPAGIDILTIPHHTGIIFNPVVPSSGPLVSFGLGFSNAQLRPLIEIYSTHGSSESYDPSHPLSYQSLRPGIREGSSGPHYAQDAWAAAETLGVIASSDDHTGRPGLEYYGLTAVYARELTRDGIWDALKNRRTYGTTGQRMIVQFDIDGKLMGSQIKLERGKYPKLHLEVHGTDDLDFVEVLRWDSRLRPQKNGHPYFETIRLIKGEGSWLRDSFLDSTYNGSSIYYLRAKQKRDIWDSTTRIFRQAWAWSSPLWVVEPQKLDTTDVAPLPKQLQIRPNHPNPFTLNTLFVYFVPRDGKVEATLYNAFGQQVQLLLNDFQTIGWHAIQVSANGLAAGIYFIRLEAAGQIRTQKIVLMK